MNYYSDYDSEPEENDGNLESKWEPVADMNIIKSVMSAVTTIIPEKETFGRVYRVNYKKLGDGLNMNARMEISTHMWTIIWVNTDSENSKQCSFTLEPTEENRQTELSRTSVTKSAEELVKLFSQDGVV